MTPKITFLLTGLVAGLATALAGPRWPTVLVFGVGPGFFIALLVALALTGTWPRISRRLWRYLAALCICTLVYLAALLTFSAVMGYSPQLIGVSESNDIVQFRTDVWIGLLAAALVASAGIELLAFALIGKWSTAVFGQLVAAGFFTICVAFLVNLMAHHYWSFLGVLLPIGEALFCALVGAQIWNSSPEETTSSWPPKPER